MLSSLSKFGSFSLTLMAYTVLCVAFFVVFNAPNGGDLPAGAWAALANSQNNSYAFGLLTAPFAHGLLSHFLANFWPLIFVFFLFLVLEQAVPELRRSSPLWLLLSLLLIELFLLVFVNKNMVGSSLFVFQATGFVAVLLVAYWKEVARLASNYLKHWRDPLVFGLLLLLLIVLYATFDNFILTFNTLASPQNYSIQKATTESIHALSFIAGVIVALAFCVKMKYLSFRQLKKAHAEKRLE